MTVEERALQVIKDGVPFSFTEGDFAFTGVRLGNEYVVPYFHRTIYVKNLRMKGHWSDPAHTVPTALRRRSK